ncbi:MAG: TonB-dependent receptor [Deltaproteobacteria bacterium]|nr:TonB-dependent receptor [Deltaproteobacteria bacterium]
MTALLLALLPVAGAAEIVDPFAEADESALFRMDEQLVTVASRYEQTLRKAPSIVTLITADQLRARNYHSLDEVLSDLPGLYVWRSQEGRAVVSFRGVVSADNNKVLLLVDGVPWYDGVYTHASIDDFLPLQNVRQIEVIKGPGSAIYGTNAFAGVINIVTYQGSELDGTRLTWTAGGEGLSDLAMNAGGRGIIAGWESQAAAFVRVYGRTGPGIDMIPKGRHDILGDDQRESVNVGMKVQVEDLSLQVQHVDFRHVYLVTENDDPWDAVAKDLNQFGLYYHDTFGSLRWQKEINEDLAVTPYLMGQRHNNPGSYYYLTGYTTDWVQDHWETDLHQTTVETAKDTVRWSTGVDAEAHLAMDHTTVAGLGFEETRVLELADYEYIDGSHDYIDPSFWVDEGMALRNAFTFAQHTWTATHYLELTGGARLDKFFPVEGMDPDNAAFRPTFSPRAGVLVVPNERLVAKLLYGQAFRAGNVRELLVDVADTADWAKGNLNLRPERIHTAEAEVTGDLNERFSGRLDASWSTVVNEIDKVRDAEEVLSYQNLAEHLNILGLETEARASLPRLDASLAWAWTHANYSKTTGTDWAGRQQYEFPAHMLKGMVDLHPTDKLHAVARGQLYGARPRADWSPTAGMEDGKPFGLLHLSVMADGLDKAGKTTLALSIQNVFDTAWGTGSYRDDADVGAPGAPKYPLEIEGATRTVRVSVQTKL